jgi:hypothetical protein
MTDTATIDNCYPAKDEKGAFDVNFKRLRPEWENSKVYSAEISGDIFLR